MTTIAAVCNVYNDAMALRGMLETSSQFFDEIFILHTGPQGAYSTDGTIELCESFGVKLAFDDIQHGYGVIRSRLLHDHGCEWGMILDADERFYPSLPHMTCEGSDGWNVGDMKRIPDLKVQKWGVNHQGERLRQVISDPAVMAVRTTRRHWIDFTFSKPSQNFTQIRDFQLRIVRNDPNINYRAEVRMHERLIDVRTGIEPAQYGRDGGDDFFHDHFHPFFRMARPGHKEFNEQNYQRLERGETMSPVERIPHEDIRN